MMDPFYREFKNGAYEGEHAAEIGEEFYLFSTSQLYIHLTLPEVAELYDFLSAHKALFQKESNDEQ